MYKYFLLLLGVIFTLTACDKDNHEDNPNFQLEFSADTITFDTLITGKVSTTQRLKIYNNSDKKIRINTLQLQHPDSPYHLNINGINSNNFTDITIAKNDSIFVFIAVDLTDKNSSTARLLEDNILLNTNNSQQKAVLQTWALDVTRITENINKNTTWNKGKPYLIAKDITVEKNTELNITAGTMVLFEKKSSLKVDGSLKVTGSFKEPVIFRGTRFEELYKNIPSQWGGILFAENSSHHTLGHFVLRNSSRGLFTTENGIADDTIHLNYGYISDCAESAVLVRNRNLKMHDMLITNFGGAGVKSEGSGNIAVFHTTFFNKWFFDSRTSPIIDISENNKGSFTIGNSIIWGNDTDEIALGNIAESNIVNCLVKISLSTKKDYDAAFKTCIFNTNPLFEDEDKYNFRLQEKSPCIGAGEKNIGITYPFNFDGEKREIINIGCY